MPEPALTNQQPEPCVWVRDLDDTTSEAGRLAVAKIRRQCPCKECEKLREDEHVAV